MALLMASGRVGSRNRTDVERLYRDAALHDNSAAMVDHAKVLASTGQISDLEAAYAWATLADFREIKEAADLKNKLAGELRKHGREPQESAKDAAFAELRAASGTKIVVP